MYYLVHVFQHLWLGSAPLKLECSRRARERVSSYRTSTSIYSNTAFYQQAAR